MPFNEVPHLFVVLNDPCLEGMCLAVMLTTIKDGRKHDATCTFKGGEHPFITHPTFALYRLAEQHSARHIANMVAKRYYVPKDDAGEAVLTAVTKGLFESDETKMRMIRYATDLGL